MLTQQVKDKVEDKIAHLKEKVQKLEDKEGKYKRIAQFAASAGLFAAAAAAIAGVFSFGTASLVVPLVISTVGPIVSFHATHKSQSGHLSYFLDLLRRN
jgi:Flp pilus assembly protein TadB